VQKVVTLYDYISEDDVKAITQSPQTQAK